MPTLKFFFVLHQEVQLFLHLLYQSSNSILDFNLQILSSTSIFVLLSPDYHFKLIKLVGSKLSNFESENPIGWKRSSNFISLHLAYRKCNKSTKLRSFLAYFTRQKQFFQKTLKISAPKSCKKIQNCSL